ncbi:hypothetical protein [uncultured Fibrobacter sp.]|uniref:hypothetical protein n=1 Tax=uncultured Fibrobacter sp. TaxID=261512 RepID=UPI0025E34D28|nr:hypothetical protein [uncultured Fibrobacter sp.]
MKKSQKISFVIFIAFVSFAVVFSYLIKAQFIKEPDKPWHMQFSPSEDSLSVDYIQQYKLLDKQRLVGKFSDSSRITVTILVDAWGVPFESSLLHEDFAAFDGLPHKEYLHQRLANRTRHAELVELRIHRGALDSVNFNDSVISSGIYLFGGDSLEYGRNFYIDSLNYGKHIFCQKCADSVIANILDSVLTAAEGDSASLVKYVAWTTQDSRDGDRAKLRVTLRHIADVARKHPEVRFIVQGTHCPILGDPRIRRESFARWVPALVIN